MSAPAWLSEPWPRLTGLVYLLYLLGIKLAWVMVESDPTLCRAALLMASFSFLVLGILFFIMFRAVSRRLALDVAVFAVAGGTVGILHLFDILTHLSTVPFLGVFLLLTGILIVRSTFLPRILGGLVALTGLGWLAFLYPPFASHTHGHMSDFSFVTEGLLVLWLLVKGIDLTRWQQGMAISPREC